MRRSSREATAMPRAGRTRGPRASSARDVPRARQCQRIHEKARDDRGARGAKLAEQKRERQCGDPEPDAVEEERTAPASDPHARRVRVEEERILVLDRVGVEAVTVEDSRCDAEEDSLIARENRLAAKQHERDSEHQRPGADNDPARAHRRNDRAAGGAPSCQGFDGDPCAAAASRRSSSIRLT